ncbi:MAG: phytanoyl-CoA dioxygenase family protein [Candidatus Poribacteria bacterium]|nr:phytanoyl-CoA dioxygenase family protein [Candidatus Poribacteria bacterium]
MNEIQQLQLYGFCTIAGAYEVNSLSNECLRMFDKLSSNVVDANENEVLNHALNACPIVKNIVEALIGTEHTRTASFKRTLPNDTSFSCTYHVHCDETESLALDNYNNRLRKSPHVPCMINSIITLTDFTADNGFGVIPMSHHSPFLKRHQFLTAVDPVVENDFLFPVIAPAGSVILWDNRLWHAQLPNKTDESRLNINVSYFAKWWRNY